jgi:phenylalanyl-tRNA synthetase alpha chain
VSNTEVTDKLNRLKDRALLALKQAPDAPEVYRLKSEYAGKKSPLSEVLKTLGGLSIDEKRAVGGLANAVKREIAAAVEARIAELAAGAVSVDCDAGLPGLAVPVGRLHPLSLVLSEIKTVFARMGFTTAEGPEVETDYYNFEALNTPKHHPAREMQDTFYVADEIVLRTHTSPVQIRVMEKQKPPVRIIVPGRVYRCDSDVSHSPMFHQVEGLYVDDGVTFADLKGTLDAFFKAMYGPEVKTRFRPSFFPFTEPSAEMDVQCFFCGGKGCPICKRSGWLEIGGCGMVDPNVFKAVNINPEKYTGFAFGVGIERIAMLKYGIDDIRLFFENDMRFLEQFI